LWVDYEAAVSLHRASDRKPGMTSQSRSDRLENPTTLDNRASHGCINVSVPFYDDFIRPAFEGTPGIVYVLPETRSAREEFNITAWSARTCAPQRIRGHWPADCMSPEGLAGTNVRRRGPWPTGSVSRPSPNSRKPPALPARCGW